MNRIEGSPELEQPARSNVKNEVPEITRRTLTLLSVARAAPFPESVS
jgi:hypothetical protein